MYEGQQVVRKAVRDVFAAFGKTGLLIAAASSVHPMMPWKNTLAMLDEWRKLRQGVDRVHVRKVRRHLSRLSEGLGVPRNPRSGC
jgi:hypothetical protein